MVIAEHRAARGYMLLQQRDQLDVVLALNLIDNRDACRPAVHAEGPLDVLWELASEVPSAPAYLRFINLNWSWQLQERQDFPLHEVYIRPSEKSKQLYQLGAPTRHAPSHLGRRASYPHLETKVKQHQVVAV